jgi:hypothetical protein
MEGNVSRQAREAWFRPVAHLQRESSIDSAYPRPCDRRLSRKTRTAVGKPPGSTTAVPGVSSADSLGANALAIGHQIVLRYPYCCCNQNEIGAASTRSISHWLSQPG